MKTLSLFELPEVLFNKFLNHLGVKDIKTFTLNYQNENVNCLYATLPRHSDFEHPTLVLVDKREIFGQTKVVILNSLPVIRDGEVSDLRDYVSISATHHSNNKGGFEISLKVNLPYSGCIDIGDPYTMFSSRYLRELHDKAEELFQSKKYDWVKQYKK